MPGCSAEGLNRLDETLYAYAGVCDLLLEASARRRDVPTLAHVDAEALWFLLDLLRQRFGEARAALERD
jgi:hypothetical protein